MPKPAIEVDGTRELRRIIKRIENQEMKAGLKDANKKAAEVIAEPAQKEAPRDSGALAKSVRATGGIASGAVKVGSKARVPYAGVIHFGWPARNIQPQPFVTEALQEHLGDARDVYEEILSEVIRLLETDSRFRL